MSTIDHPLILVRHGATQWNLEGRYQGATDTDLSPVGAKQASLNTKLVEDLVANGTLDPDQISVVSSPLQRARQTAAIISDAMDIPLTTQINPAFRELSLGRWEGLTSAEVKSQFYDERKNRKSDRWNFKPLGGDSMEDRQNEIESALQSISAHTIIVTHAVVLRVILHLLGRLSREQAAVEHPNHVGIMIWDGAILHRQG